MTVIEKASTRSQIFNFKWVHKFLRNFFIYLCSFYTSKVSFALYFRKIIVFSHAPNLMHKLLISVAELSSRQIFLLSFARWRIIIISMYTKNHLFNKHIRKKYINSSPWISPRVCVFLCDYNFSLFNFSSICHVHCECVIENFYYKISCN